MKPVEKKKVPAVKKESKFSFKGLFSKSINWLFAEDVYYRLGGFLIYGLILFLIVWACFTFLVKAPNALGESFLVQKVLKAQLNRSIGAWGTQHFGSTWNIFKWHIDVAQTFMLWGNVFALTFKYFLNHLLFIIPFIFFFNLFKVGRWSLSLIYFTVYTIMWGAVVGTSSLPFPTGNNVVFGPLLLFLRFGIWAWFAYLLLAVSTTQFAWLVAPSWLNWGWEIKRKIWPVSFTPDQKELFIYGLLFLLAASFAEARIFVHYNLF